ncbi:MAG: hypothetical protein AAGA37_23260 [Actinomycetota bacterium]
MTATLEHTSPSSPPSRWATARDVLRRPVWNRFTVLQCLVLVAGAVAPAIILGTIGARLLGLITTEAMIETVLGAGEEPGMFTFGAMLLASPIQWLTGRTQVRVRKYVGIVFFLLALSNGAMFAIESGVAASFSAPFLIAGSLALLVSAPLFLTSSRRSQRAMGMRHWRMLHRATYVVGVALLSHVILIPGESEIGISAMLIALGLVLRVPPIARLLQRRQERQARSSVVAQADGWA